MADAKARPKSLTDLMHEINSNRKYMYRTFKALDEFKDRVPEEIAVTVLSFDRNDNLMFTYHDVRQPLVHHTDRAVHVKLWFGIVGEEQTENKLPEEKAAESAPTA